METERLASTTAEEGAKITTLICVHLSHHVIPILEHPTSESSRTLRADIDGCFVKSTVIHPVGNNILSFIKALLLFIVPFTSYLP